MATASTRAATKTKLVWGTLETEVALYTTKASPSALADFDTAGPNGGKLHMEQRAVKVESAELSPGEEPVRADPLAENPIEADPGPDSHDDLMATYAHDDDDVAVVEGEYRSVLVEDGTGQEVLPDQVRRGVRREDGTFVDVTDQVRAIAERTKLSQMAIVAFIDVGQVERDRVTASYFLGTGEDEPRPLRLLYEAMRKTRRAAVVKLTKTSRQSLGVIVADGRSKTLKVLDLIWHEDVREAPPRALSIQKAVVTESEVESACELIRAMSDTPEALNELRDDAIALREELRTRAEEGEMDVQVVEPVTPVEEKAEADLEGALEASLAALR